MPKISDVLSKDKLEELKKEPYEVQQDVIRHYSPELFNEPYEVQQDVIRHYGFKLNNESKPTTFREDISKGLTSTGEWMEGARKTMSPYVRPALQTAGSIIGGTVAIPANIVAPIASEAAGIGLGYLGGSKLADIYDQYIQNMEGKPVETTGQQLHKTLTRQIPEAGIMGALGPIFSKGLSLGLGYLSTKIPSALTGASENAINIAKTRPKPYVEAMKGIIPEEDIIRGIEPLGKVEKGTLYNRVESIKNILDDFRKQTDSFTLSKTMNPLPGKNILPFKNIESYGIKPYRTRINKLLDDIVKDGETKETLNSFRNIAGEIGQRFTKDKYWRENIVIPQITKEASELLTQKLAAEEMRPLLTNYVRTLSQGNLIAPLEFSSIILGVVTHAPTISTIASLGSMASSPRLNSWVLPVIHNLTNPKVLNPIIYGSYALANKNESLVPKIAEVINPISTSEAASTSDTIKNRSKQIEESTTENMPITQIKEPIVSVDQSYLPSNYTKSIDKKTGKQVSVQIKDDGTRRVWNEDKGWLLISPKEHSRYILR